MRRARRNLLVGWCALLAVLAGCSEPPSARSTAEVVVLVLIDGVPESGSAERWAAALGPNTWAGEAGVVSTSAAATFASILTGLEPPEHGRISARDFGVELRGTTFVEALAGRAALPDARIFSCVAACVLRELAPELVGLARGFDNWLAVRPSVFGAALDALAPSFDAARSSGRGLLAVAIEALPERPATGNWPPSIARDLEREVAPFLAPERVAPSFERADLWFTREWLADVNVGPALERAWYAANDRALCERLTALAQRLGAEHDDWCVVVAGLRPAGLHTIDATSARVPIAAGWSREPCERVGELVDLGCAIGRRCGAPCREPRATQELLGVWNGGGGLRGTRAAWSDVPGVWSGRISEPPAVALVFELDPAATQVHVELHGDRPTFAGDPVGKVLIELAFELQPGERRVVPLVTSAPRLLLEFSSAGRALPPTGLAFDGHALEGVALPRLLDGRGPALAEAELHDHLNITRGERGRHTLFAQLDTPPLVFTWPWSDDAIEARAVIESDEPAWQFVARSATRIALLAGAASNGPADKRRRFEPSARFAIDGCADEPGALRLLWPAVSSERLEPSLTASAEATLRVSTIGAVAPLCHEPAELRGLMKSLRPWE